MSTDALAPTTRTPSPTTALRLPIPTIDLADVAERVLTGLFVGGAGTVRPAVPVAELQAALGRLGGERRRLAGAGGRHLRQLWERAGLVAPGVPDDPHLVLLERGHTILAGPFRSTRLHRVLTRQAQPDYWTAGPVTG